MSASIMNVDTLSSLEQVGSALTAIAGDGSGVDNEGKVRNLQRFKKKNVYFFFFYVRMVMLLK